MTILSILCILWMLFNDIQVPFRAPRIPFAGDEFQSKKYLELPAWMLYLGISNLFGLAGCIYIYVVHF